MFTAGILSSCFVALPRSVPIPTGRAPSLAQPPMQEPPKHPEHPRNPTQLIFALFPPSRLVVLVEALLASPLLGLLADQSLLDYRALHTPYPRQEYLSIIVL